MQDPTQPLDPAFAFPTSSTGAPAVPPTDEPPADMAPYAPVRILVAGSGAAGTLLARQLASLGHVVVATASGPAETLSGARAALPEVVILDPEVAGDVNDDLARALAELPDTAVIRFAERDDAPRAAGGSADGHAFAVLPLPTPRTLLEITIREAAAPGRRRTDAAPAAVNDRAAIEAATRVLMERTGGSRHDAAQLLTDAAAAGASATAGVARLVLASAPATPRQHGR